MRKSDLIKKLQGIKGNPEVVLFNGYADDWKLLPVQYLSDHMGNKYNRKEVVWLQG